MEFVVSGVRAFPLTRTREISTDVLSLPPASSSSGLPTKTGRRISDPTQARRGLPAAAESAEVPLIKPIETSAEVDPALWPPTPGTRKSVFGLFENPTQIPAIPSISTLANLGPHGSARGGKGGLVTSLKNVFAGLKVGREAPPAGNERPRAVKRMSRPVNAGRA